ncbi:AraC family transcriptional regulator [Paenibacillus soyae]|uniref:AraC family transcriptional regulator n=1 Tax=Paenibacillus soyae TaxID=2969249 RepID=A0A9X2MR49_9BACL|nr:AraC family transcriptional regulator [Paenibacillus soyae]MCR2804241.1 AraC family transcriptional regulator [Paenibacillus soyae]
MRLEAPLGIYGFRFNDLPNQPLCSLYAVGHETIRDSSYDWDGLTRSDGPLYLFQYTVQGEGIFEYEGTPERIHSGRAFLTEIPGNHRYYHPGGSEPWEFYFVLFRPVLITPLWEEIVSAIGHSPSFDAGSLPIQALKDMFYAAHYGKITDAYKASAFVYQFVIELRRACAAVGQSPEQRPELVRKAVQYLDANYGQSLGQEQLAAQLGVSKFHFLRTFARHVGMTPNEYVNRKRIERSIELLRTTDWSIDLIAETVGYSTGSYYIKVFKKLTGGTPGDYRAAGNHLQFNKLFFD